MCEKTLLDYVATFLPILLSAMLIIQNHIINNRNKKLQKEIHNRDVRLRQHDDILSIYSVYYEFMDLMYTSNFAFEVKQGNVNFVMNFRNTLIQMRTIIFKKLDLAALLFKRSDNKLFTLIEERYKLSIEIIDKYMKYINGDFNSVASQAWNKICIINPNIIQGNYFLLHQNQEISNDFLKMCETNETKELDDLLTKHRDLHTYENYDIYFEKYLGIEELK